MRQYQLGWRAVIDLADRGYGGSVGKWLSSKQKSHYKEDICISAVLPLIVSLHYDALIGDTTDEIMKKRLTRAKLNSVKIHRSFDVSRIISLNGDIVEQWAYLLEQNPKDIDEEWTEDYFIKMAELATALIGRYGQGFHYVDANPVGNFEAFPNLIVETLSN